MRRQGWARSAAPRFASTPPAEIQRRIDAGYTITGKTFPHRDKLRELGGAWSGTTWVMPNEAARARGQALVDGATFATFQPPPLAAPAPVSVSSTLQAILEGVAKANGSYPFLHVVFPPARLDLPLLDWAARQKPVAAPAPVARRAFSRPTTAKKDEDELVVRKKKDGYDQSWEARVAAAARRDGEWIKTFDIDC
jgi:hypothetical protein